MDPRSTESECVNSLQRGNDFLGSRRPKLIKLKGLTLLNRDMFTTSVSCG